MAFTSLPTGFVAHRHFIIDIVILKLVYAFLDEFPSREVASIEEFTCTGKVVVRILYTIIYTVDIILSHAGIYLYVNQI